MMFVRPIGFTKEQKEYWIFLRVPSRVSPRLSKHTKKTLTDEGQQKQIHTYPNTLQNTKMCRAENQEVDGKYAKHFDFKRKL